MNESIRRNKIAELLIQNRTTEINWRWLSMGNLSKKNANKFLLACILDYRIKAETAWDNAERLAEVILNDPSDLWETIVKTPKSKWMDKFKVYKLHRYPKAHERIWRIGKEIIENYQGDARKIWKNAENIEILKRLEKMRVGKQISRMILGALYDNKQIKGKMDVKADIHVTRVLGRLIQGEQFLPKIAVEEAKKLSPKNPWLIDNTLYFTGQNVCKSEPLCDHCTFQKYCKYNNS